MGPVTAIDPADRLLRHAHCDGSVRPGHLLPRDLEATTLVGHLLGTVPPDAVVCLDSAWAVHTSAGELPPGPVHIVPGGHIPPLAPGVRVYRCALPPAHVASVGSLLLTTAERTLVDLARLAPLPAAAQACVTARSFLAPDPVREVLDSQCGLKGIPRARRLLEMVFFGP
ncbi:MAG: hypothetical protein Q4G64_06580 [bacterium]|nr:hypothetical protein [bacterium]